MKFGYKSSSSKMFDMSWSSDTCLLKAASDDI